MSSDNYDAIMTLIFGYEGGYADNPADPGGATNMGISHKVLAAWRGVPDISAAEIRAVTKAEAEAIYRARYWNAIKGDDLPSGIDFATMDAAVNSGPANGIEWMQQAVGTIADGIVGPKTLAAAKAADPVAAIGAICDRRLTFCHGLSTWPTFGKGWTNRIDDVRENAFAMARAAAATVTSAVQGASTAAAPITSAPPAASPSSDAADGSVSTADGPVAGAPTATVDRWQTLLAWLLGLLRTA